MTQRTLSGLMLASLAVILALAPCAALAADQPAQPVPMPGATAVTSDAFGAAGAGDTSKAPTGIDLKGYKMVWNDEFSEVSWTSTNPKKSAKWFSFPSVGGKFIGQQKHDDESMVIKDGVLINTMVVRTQKDVAGSRCAGPVGMKDGSGKELITVEKLGLVKKEDKRLQWNTSGWVGMKFTTPKEGLTVSELGVYAIPGKSEEHEMRIFDATTGDDVAKAVAKFDKGAVPKTEGWVYAPIVGGKKTLAGDHTYYLMLNTLGWSYSKNGYASDSWYDGNTMVKADDGITISQSEWGNWHAGSLFSIDQSKAGFTQLYGYWEARVKMPAGGVGIWPSWCLYSVKENKGLSEEIDIFEEYGGAYAADKDGGFGMRNGNWGKGGDATDANKANVWPAVSKPWLNWHVYGFLSTPTKCSFYVDGDKKGEFDTPTNYMVNPFYMTLEYNNGGFWPITGVISNSHMDVDWVRVWALPDK